MRAVVMRSFGDSGVLAVETVDDPIPRDDEVLVKVGSVAVSNTRDVATRSGRHPFSQHLALPHVLGGDFAGTVIASGASVADSVVGQRVAVSNSVGCGTCAACQAGNRAQCEQLVMLGIHRWGSYAEMIAVPAANLQQIPDDMGLPEAASLAANGPIALTQLTAAQVSASTALLITGATGALGTTLLALASHIGATAIGLSRRPLTLPARLAAGAVDSSSPDLADEVNALLGGREVTAVIDNVADGQTFQRYFPTLAIGGRIVVSGAIAAGGPPVLPVPAIPLYLRSISLLGIRTTSLADIGRFWDIVRSGFRLPGNVIEEFSLDDAAAAQDRSSAGAVVGHVVVTSA